MSDEFSREGDTNLQILASANNFTLWMYEQIKPFLKGNILEIGSGRGNYSKIIINSFPQNRIILSDISENYVKDLKKQFESSNVVAVKLNLEKKGDFEKINTNIDSAFALNVMEHIENDIDAMNNLYEKLNKGGTFTILVPAHKFLYNCIDKSVGHYRRYTRKDLLKKVSQTKFKVKKLFYFNALPILGWYWSGNILKKDILSKNNMRLFDTLVPLLRFIEKYILRKKIGMSLVAVLVK